jgi:hypothetical protein
MRTGRNRPKMYYLSLSRVFDGIWTALKQFESQEAIVVRGLILGRNTEPNMIRVE